MHGASRYLLWDSPVTFTSLLPKRTCNDKDRLFFLNSSQWVTHCRSEVMITHRCPDIQASSCIVVVCLRTLPSWVHGTGLLSRAKLWRKEKQHGLDNNRRFLHMTANSLILEVEGQEEVSIIISKSFRNVSITTTKKLVFDVVQTTVRTRARCSCKIRLVFESPNRVRLYSHQNKYDHYLYSPVRTQAPSHVLLVRLEMTTCEWFQGSISHIYECIAEVSSWDPEDIHAVTT